MPRISESNLFSATEDSTYPYKLTLGRNSDTTSKNTLSMVMNITSLSQGTTYKVVKEISDGSHHISNSITLDTGSNTKTINSVNFNRNVFLQFSSGDIEFDSLIVNSATLHPINIDKPVKLTESWGKQQFSRIETSNNAIFGTALEPLYGINFEVQNGTTQNQYAKSPERLTDALNKVEKLGYNVIRTFGHSDYSTSIYQNINTYGRKVKVQQGLNITSNDLDTCKNELDTMMNALVSFSNHILGISLLNETENDVSPRTLEGLIDHFKNTYGNSFICTCNFLSATGNNSDFADVHSKLDYICINEYGSYFDYNTQLSVDDQINLLSKKEYTQIPSGKMLVVGETGWQAQSRGVGSDFDNLLTSQNLASYYYNITRRIYNKKDTPFAFMFYYGLSNAANKNETSTGGYNKDGWGLFLEGDSNGVGNAVDPVVNIPVNNIVNANYSGPSIFDFNSKQGLDMQKVDNHGTLLPKFPNMKFQKNGWDLNGPENWKTNGLGEFEISNVIGQRFRKLNYERPLIDGIYLFQCIFSNVHMVKGGICELSLFSHHPKKTLVKIQANGNDKTLKICKNDIVSNVQKVVSALYGDFEPVVVSIKVNLNNHSLDFYKNAEKLNNDPVFFENTKNITGILLNTAPGFTQKNKYCIKSLGLYNFNDENSFLTNNQVFETFLMRRDKLT